MTEFTWTAEAVLRTLVVSDLVDSTSLIEKIGDRQASEVFALHDRLARDLLVEHRGREIDKTDGFLLLFERPLHAVTYALAYHEELDRFCSEAGLQLASRVGIHLGEVFLRENSEADVSRGAKPFEVEGLAKAMAARLMSMALGRQTLLTRGVFDVARRAAVGSESLRVGLRWLAHGEYLIQGVEEPTSVYEVGIAGKSPLTAPPDSDKTRRTYREKLVLGWRPAAGLCIPSRSHWVLDEKKGEGGFGEVWLARHQKTGERRVFKFCFDIDRLRALQRETTVFRLLREELGERDDIARILDWNFDEPPYFVESEYTAGGSLIDWAQRQGGLQDVALPVRLQIVTQVAEGLAAAHSVGVLHRDVKPGNVLIHANADGSIQARLCDFGMGVLTDEERLRSAGITALGMTRGDGSTSSGSTSGTVLYNAPELAEGKAATIQADIYALGVVLYQLVVGDLFQALGSGWERRVENELLREDIAATVDINPQRRLGNALRLAERLKSLELRRAEREAERRTREESERAVAAHQRTRRRQKLATVLFASVTLFALVVGVQSRRIALEAKRAQREANKARAVSQFLEEALGSTQPFEDSGRDVGLVEALLHAGEVVDTLFADQPDLQAEVRTVLGHTLHYQGEYDHAASHLEQAVALLETLEGDEAELRDAEVLMDLGRVYRDQARFEEAGTAFRRSLAIQTRLLGEEHLDSAESLNGLGTILATLGDFDGAEDAFRRVVQIRESLLGPDDEMIAFAVQNVGTLFAMQGQFAEAEPFGRRSLEILRKTKGPNSPLVANSLHDLANTYKHLGTYDRAEPLFAEAMSIRERVLGAMHPDTGETLQDLGEIFWVTGRYDLAESHFERVREICEQSLGDQSPLTGQNEFALAQLRRDQQRINEATEHFRRSVLIREELLGRDHPAVLETRGAFALFLADTGGELARYGLDEADVARGANLTTPFGPPTVR